MYFRHNVDDTIEINGVKFEYETFLDVEPDYTKPVGMSWRHYEQGSYHKIHNTDGSQTGGEYPWEDGDRYISRLGDFKVMQQEEQSDKKTIADRIEELNINKSKEPTEKTVNFVDKIEALWDHIVLGKPKEDTIDPLVKLLTKDQKPMQEYEDLL